MSWPHGKPSSKGSSSSETHGAHEGERLLPSWTGGGGGQLEGSGSDGPDCIEGDDATHAAGKAFEGFGKPSEGCGCSKALEGLTGARSETVGFAFGDATLLTLVALSK